MIKLLLASCLLSATPMAALAAAADWESDVKKFDSDYWAAYNRCDVNKMAGMKTKDFEFYHDVGGVTKGRDTFAAAIKAKLCSNPKLRVRREAVLDTIRVFPMRDQGKLYGALISGEHRFFNAEVGKSEVATGTARFTHFLTLTHGAWHMARVLSFDHAPVKFEHKFVEVTLSPVEMDRYTGRYTSGDGPGILVLRTGNRLSLASGPTTFELIPMSAASYFVKDRDLTFVFSIDAAGQRRVAVQEGGKTVEEAVATGGK